MGLSIRSIFFFTTFIGYEYTRFDIMTLSGPTYATKEMKLIFKILHNNTELTSNVEIYDEKLNFL